MTATVTLHTLYYNIYLLAADNNMLCGTLVRHNYTATDVRTDAIYITRLL